MRIEAHMELNLRVLPNRLRLSLHRSHTLNAPDGRRLAFITPAPDGWRCYPLLADASSALLNGQPISPGRPLAVGDRLDFAGQRLFVESQAIEIEPRDRSSGHSEPTLPRCRVVVPRRIEITTDRELLIGSAVQCKLCLPAGLEIEPLQALLIPTGQEWVLHDLTGKGLARTGEESERSLVLADGDHVRMGRIEIAFWFEDQHQEEPSSEVIDTAAQAAGSTDTGPCLPRLAEDPLYARSVRLCQQLFAGTLQPSANNAGLLGRMWSRLGGQEEPEVALDRLQDQLAQKPTRGAWLQLARFFAEQEYVDLCRLVLHHLVKRYPDDEEVLVPLARACVRQGQDTTRPMTKRREDYNSAEQCIERALRLRPQETLLLDLKRQIAVERTILIGNLDRAGRTKKEA